LLRQFRTRNSHTNPAPLRRHSTQNGSPRQIVPGFPRFAGRLSAVGAVTRKTTVQSPAFTPANRTTLPVLGGCRVPHPQPLEGAVFPLDSNQSPVHQLQNSKTLLFRPSQGDAFSSHSLLRMCRLAQWRNPGKKLTKQESMGFTTSPRSHRPRNFPSPNLANLLPHHRIPLLAPKRLREIRHIR
jgi:hypothetical protein